VRRVVVRPAAAADIEDAYEWYESRHAGLGDEFLAALQAVQDRLIEHPEAHPVVHRNTRRALIQRRFPYAFFRLAHPGICSAISTNRHSALINRICSIVRARDSSSRGLATMNARHVGREILVCLTSAGLALRAAAARLSRSFQSPLI
jgi:plasmid stabilization system protein ParE